MASFAKTFSPRAMRWLPVSLLCAGFTFACSADGQGPASTAPGNREFTAAPKPGDSTKGTASQKRVVGYVQTFRLQSGRSFDLSTLTHLNLAFANPIPGTETIDFPVADRAGVTRLVESAKNQGVKVFAAIGGYGSTAGPAVSKDVSGFVDEVFELVTRYGFDGVDIDIEGTDIDPEAFPRLLEQLAAQRPQGLELSAAVSNWERQRYGALDKPDFLNVMSYDQCAQWSGPCEQSTLSAAKADLEYWSTVTSPSQVVLGMPFYGRCWGDACHRGLDCSVEDNVKTCKEVVDYGYFEILASSFASTSTCQPDVLEGDKYYISLNGPVTLASKVGLSKNYGGVMIWELGHDTSDGYLLSVVRNALNGTEPQCDARTD